MGMGLNGKTVLLSMMYFVFGLRPYIAREKVLEPQYIPNFGHTEQENVLVQTAGTLVKVQGLLSQTVHASNPGITRDNPGKTAQKIRS